MIKKFVQIDRSTSEWVYVEYKDLKQGEFFKPVDQDGNFVGPIIFKCLKDAYLNDAKEWAVDADITTEIYGTNREL